MAKTLYEGMRIGRNGGERWVGTIQREAASGRIVETSDGKSPRSSVSEKTPRGGSAFSRTTPRTKSN